MKIRIVFLGAIALLLASWVKAGISDTPLRWVEIPGSAMDTVHIPDIDTDPFLDLAKYPWPGIQIAWSGAEVVGDKIYVHGGGHAKTPHNGVLAMDAAGNWERVTDPSPVWRECPDDVCAPPIGPVCPLNDCTVMPDGNPVSAHTYSLLASDGKYLYRSGGSTWPTGRAGVGPRNWKLDTTTGEWSTWPESGDEGYHGSLVHYDGKLYMTGVHGSRVFDIATQTWAARDRNRKKFGGQTPMVYGGGYLWVIGGGEAWRTTPDKFPTGWEELPHTEAVDAYGSGVVFHAGKLWVWIGGPSLSVLDPTTLEWSDVIPDGDPGPALWNGTYGRLNVLDGNIVLINGVHENAFKLIGVEPADPVDSPTTPEVGENPVIVPDPRGEEWGHTIVMKTVLGPSEPATYESCADVVDFACFEVDSEIMNGFADAVDALPDEGGVVIVNPGIHVVTRAYNHRRPFKLLHIQGVPDADGNRPIVRGTLGILQPNERGRYDRPKIEPRNFVSFSNKSRNLIVENMELQNFTGKIILVNNSAYEGSVEQTVLIKNSFLHHNWGIALSMGKGRLVNRRGRLYVIDSELGYIWSGTHLVYFAGGESFYTRKSFYHSPGWHALKVVSHNVAVLDSILSQVGLNGEPMPQVGAVNEGVRIGQGSAGSFVACQRGVFQRNLIYAWTQTAAVTRQPRHDIDACDFEVSYFPLPSGEWPRGRHPREYPEDVTDFWKSNFWLNVQAGPLEYPDAVENHHLLPIYWLGNKFVYLGDRQTRQAITNSSTWPLQPNGQPYPAEHVPNEWIERTRDVFLNNTLVDYDYPVGLHKYGSRQTGVVDQYGDFVEVDVGGNNGTKAPVPDWFVTDPIEIHPSLYPITVDEIHNLAKQ